MTKKEKKYYTYAGIALFIGFILYLIRKLVLNG
jgi:hypothetical protein|nr:MAG TPA: hypothetical protein [Caudoviricetes sp.]